MFVATMEFFNSQIGRQVWGYINVMLAVGKKTLINYSAYLILEENAESLIRKEVVSGRHASNQHA